MFSDQTTVATITNHFEVIETIPALPPAAIPQTGQSSDYNMTWMLGIAAVIFAGAGTALIIKRKRSDV